MNPRIVAATASRVGLQLRHDPRTIALLTLVPAMLVALLAWGGKVFMLAVAVTLADEHLPLADKAAIWNKLPMTRYLR